MRFLLLIFIVLPIAELWLIIEVGSAVGALPTVALVFGTAVIGLMLLRYQGLGTLLRGRERMEHGEMPTEEMFEAMVLALCGVLLVAPGLITDTFGFIGLIPPLRRWLVAKGVARLVVVGSLGARYGRGRTVEGEFWHHQDTPPPRPSTELPDHRDP